MEFAAGDAAARGVSFPMSSSYRKEWRVVSEQSLRNTANEELESLKLGKCDERLIYEQQIEPADMNLCSIPVDRRLDSDILHQRFHAITKKREELQHMEIELRAQINSGSEVMQVQNNFDAQIEEHANANVKLQNRIAQETILLKDEQLREAQSWMTRAQEMDALQSTANRTLQAELQERTERCNQLWFGCQTQFGEVERLHLHIQQPQIELADVREKSGSKSDVSRVSQTGSKDAFHVGRSNDSQVNGNFTPLENSGCLQHENAETASSLP